MSKLPSWVAVRKAVTVIIRVRLPGGSRFWRSVQRTTPTTVAVCIRSPRAPRISSRWLN
jgi:hypothetical protein